MDERKVVLRASNVKKYYKTSVKAKFTKDIKRIGEQMVQLCEELFGYKLEADLVPVKVKEENIDGDLKQLAFEYTRLKQLNGEKLFIKAVDGVNFEIHEGEVKGIVGEQNSGKTTLAMLLDFMDRQCDGDFFFLGENVRNMPKKELLMVQDRVVYLFNHYNKAVKKNAMIKDVIGKPLLQSGLYNKKDEDYTKHIAELIEEVGLEPKVIERKLKEEGSIERALVRLATALSAKAKVIILGQDLFERDDRYVTSIMSKVKLLQAKYNFAVVIISNDIKRIEKYCDRIAFMHLGTIIEEAPSASLLQDAQHPYVKMVSMGEADIQGQDDLGVTSVENHTVSGCKFHPVCPIMRDICAQECPKVEEGTKGHCVACHFKGSYIE